MAMHASEVAAELPAIMTNLSALPGTKRRPLQLLSISPIQGTAVPRLPSATLSSAHVATPMPSVVSHGPATWGAHHTFPYAMPSRPSQDPITPITPSEIGLELRAITGGRRGLRSPTHSDLPLGSYPLAGPSQRPAINTALARYAAPSLTPHAPPQSQQQLSATLTSATLPMPLLSPFQRGANPIIANSIFAMRDAMFGDQTPLAVSTADHAWLQALSHAALSEHTRPLSGIGQTAQPQAVEPIPVLATIAVASTTVASTAAASPSGSRRAPVRQRGRSMSLCQGINPYRTIL